MRQHSFLPVIAFVGACLIANGIIFGLGFNDTSPSGPQPWFAPPGWVIGVVWLVLFGLMGVIYARLQRLHPSALWSMVALAAICLAYPVYTSGLQNAFVGLIGNIATLAVTLGLIAYLRRFDRTSARLLLPMVAWLAFATVLTGTIVAAA